MQQRSKMQGLTLWGWLFVIIVLVSVLTLVMRLGPHYIDHQAISSILNGITAEEARGAKSELRKLLDKRFTVNNLRDFDIDKIVDIDRSRDGTTVTIEYEVREHLIGNLSAVLNFRDQRAF